MHQEAEDIVALAYVHLLKCLILAQQMGWLCLLPHAQETVHELRAILNLLKVDCD